MAVREAKLTEETLKKSRIVSEPKRVTMVKARPQVVAMGWLMLILIVAEGMTVNAQGILLSDMSLCRPVEALSRAAEDGYCCLVDYEAQGLKDPNSLLKTRGTMWCGRPTGVALRSWPCPSG